MKCLKVLTTICIVSCLVTNPAAGQDRKQKPNKRRPSKVTRQIILGQPLVFGVEALPEVKPYLSKAEAGCPRFCALLTTLSGVEIEPKAGVYELANQQRFQIKLLLKAARVADQEYLSMASDQGFPNPGGPTVTLSVKKTENGRLVDIPVSAPSSGGSRNLSVLRLSLSLNISYAEEERKKRARGWAEETIRFIEEEVAKEAKPTPHMPLDPEILANYLSRMAPDSQPGEYELRFTYRSKGNNVRINTLETAPLRIRIVDDGKNPFTHFFSKER